MENFSQSQLNATDNRSKNSPLNIIPCYVGRYAYYTMHSRINMRQRNGTRHTYTYTHTPIH